MNNNHLKLAPSVLSADFSQLATQISQAEAGGADWMHLDVMDGHFVPNITFGPFIVKAIRKCTSLFLDCHLMIETPEKYLSDFAEAGVNSLTVHQEAVIHLDACISRIRDLGVKAGVSLNPATPIETLSLILPKLDQVLIMTVNPGFGGQKFLPYTLEKVSGLRKQIDHAGLDIQIAVDGGIGPENAAALVEAGADILVAGSAIFSSNDITGACKKMKSAMLQASR